MALRVANQKYHAVSFMEQEESVRRELGRQARCCESFAEQNEWSKDMFSVPLPRRVVRADPGRRGDRAARGRAYRGRPAGRARVRIHSCDLVKRYDRWQKGMLRTAEEQLWPELRAANPDQVAWKHP